MALPSHYNVSPAEAKALSQDVAARFRSLGVLYHLPAPGTAAHSRGTMGVVRPAPRAADGSVSGGVLLKAMFGSVAKEFEEGFEDDVDDVVATPVEMQAFAAAFMFPTADGEAGLYSPSGAVVEQNGYSLVSEAEKRPCS